MDIDNENLIECLYRVVCIVSSGFFFFSAEPAVIVTGLD